MEEETDLSDLPILELRGVSKSFGAVQALYQVDFHVPPGEVRPSSATTARASRP